MASLLKQFPPISLNCALNYPGRSTLIIVYEPQFYHLTFSDCNVSWREKVFEKYWTLLMRKGGIEKYSNIKILPCSDRLCPWSFSLREIFLTSLWTPLNFYYKYINVWKFCKSCERIISSLNVVFHQWCYK